MIWDPGEKLVTAESLEKGFNTAKLLCSTYEDPKQCDPARKTTSPMEMKMGSLDKM